MLKDVNDSPRHAKALIKLMSGIPAKFNLIPFNAWPGAIYECSARARPWRPSPSSSTRPDTPPPYASPRPRHHGRLRTTQIRLGEGEEVGAQCPVLA